MQFFDLFGDQIVMVCKACTWFLGCWTWRTWNLWFTSSPIPSESRTQLHGLQEILLNTSFDLLVEDSVVWWRELSSFSIKSAYKIVYAISSPNFLFDAKLAAALALSWSSWVPSNIHFFLGDFY